MIKTYEYDPDDFNETGDYEIDETVIETGGGDWYEDVTEESMFLGLSEYGFNFDNGYRFQRLSAYMTIEDYDSSSGDVSVKTKGGAYRTATYTSYHEDPYASESVRKPNAMKGIVFVCKDETICRNTEDYFSDSDVSAKDVDEEVSNYIRDFEFKD